MHDFYTDAQKYLMEQSRLRRWQEKIKNERFLDEMETQPWEHQMYIVL